MYAIADIDKEGWVKDDRIADLRIAVAIGDGRWNIVNEVEGLLVAPRPAYPAEGRMVERCCSSRSAAAINGLLAT